MRELLGISTGTEQHQTVGANFKGFFRMPDRSHVREHLDQAEYAGGCGSAAMRRKQPTCGHVICIRREKEARNGRKFVRQKTQNRSVRLEASAAISARPRPLQHFLPRGMLPPTEN